MDHASSGTPAPGSTPAVGEPATLESLILVPVPARTKAWWDGLKAEGGAETKSAFSLLEKTAALIGLVASLPVLAVMLPFGLAALPFYHIGERLEASRSGWRKLRWLFLGPAMALLVVGMLAGLAAGAYAIWLFVSERGAREHYSRLIKAGGQWFVLAGMLVFGLKVAAPRLQLLLLAGANRVPGLLLRRRGGRVDRLVESFVMWTTIFILLGVFTALLVAFPSLQPHVPGQVPSGP